MSQGFTKNVLLDTDPTLAGDSDYIAPSQSAVKDALANKTHNSLSGLNVGDYQHLTAADNTEAIAFLNGGTSTHTAVDAGIVTNGNSHDHNGGDGSQIAHTSLSSIGTNTHAQIDTFISDNNVTSYTTTWSSSSNPQPSLGNGTLTARYSIAGKKVTVNIYLLMGSTTSFGTGEWAFTLPFTGLSGIVAVGNWVALDSGTAYYTGGAENVNNAGRVQLVSNASGNKIGPTVPFTWTNGDYIAIGITYLI